MKIEQYHIYTLKNNLFGDVISHVVVIQNDKANNLSDYIVVIPYVNGEFKGIHTVKRESLKEEIGILSSDKQEKLKEYYYSFVIG